ncbi:cytochrome P450, partial [Actinoallomurus acaciae]
SQDYNLGKPNKDATEDYIMRKGEGLIIPVWAFHRDPKYFPNPEKFDPERFSEDNRHDINPYAYMPFGAGPRNCIGSRFALCEVKATLYQLLRQFEISPSEKTVLPIQMCEKSVNIKMKGGHWFRLRARK